MTGTSERHTVPCRPHPSAGLDAPERGRRSGGAAGLPAPGEDLPEEVAHPLRGTLGGGVRALVEVVGGGATGHLLTERPGRSPAPVPAAGGAVVGLRRRPFGHGLLLVPGQRIAPGIAAEPRVAPGAAPERPGGVGPPRPPSAMQRIAEGAERVTEPGRAWGTPATGTAAELSVRIGPEDL